MTPGGSGAVWIFKSSNPALGTDVVVVQCGYLIALPSGFLGHKPVDNICRVHGSRPTAVQSHQHNTST